MDEMNNGTCPPASAECWSPELRLAGCCYRCLVYGCGSVTQPYPTLCDPMDWSTPGFPVLHCLLVYTLVRLPAFSGLWKPSISQSVSSVAQSCPSLCDPMNCSMPGLPVLHQLPEFTQTHAHRVSDAIQPSHPLSSPSPRAPNPSQHQGLFQ